MSVDGSSDVEEVDDISLTGLLDDGDDGTSADSRHRVTIEHDHLTRRMAAQLVRRVCNQHGCTASTAGECRHPDHRRDLDFLRHCFQLLGLDKNLQPVEVDERRGFLRGLARHPKG